MPNKDNDDPFVNAENALKKGDNGPIRAYLVQRRAEMEDVLAATGNQAMQQHRIRSEFEQVRYNILHELITAPERFADHRMAFETITENKFDFDDFYTHSEDIIDAADIVGMYATCAKPDVAEIAGIFLAEHLKYKLGWDKGHRLELQEIIKDVKILQSESLSAQSARVTVINAFIAVQNALVNHVAKNGSAQPDDRAAAYLAQHQDEFPQIARFWTQKITSIVEFGAAVTGKTVQYVPAFGPEEP